MGKVVRNSWREADAAGRSTVSSILRADVDPEGLDIDRVRFLRDSILRIDANGGEIIAVVCGTGALHTSDSLSLDLRAGTHVFVPPSGATLHAEAGADIVRVRSGTLHEATGTELILRDECFVYAASTKTRSLRWVLTPQYLSRRVFLRHDKTIVSKSGDPVSWHHTTMFDVAGLPLNEEGRPVFKMSYNSRTETNVCYDVAGIARVRMAQHPYAAAGQIWGEWTELDGESTYHLDEAAGGSHEERIVDASGETRSLRNKHEVYIDRGYVSLYCLLDPAAVGFERHRPGEYTDYESYASVADTPECAAHYAEIAEYDAMVDALSVARATGSLDRLRGASAWELYRRGFAAQSERESEVHATLAHEGAGRERIIEPWMRPFSSPV